MPKLKLTRKELGELIFEAIVTMTMLFFLFVGFYLIFNQIVQTPSDLLIKTNSLWDMILYFDFILLEYRAIFLIFALLVSIIFTWWRLFRRYNQMQLRHILAELHYIASGNFDHRIKANLTGDMNDVVNSINTLVESTVAAMDEERKIEQSKDELITNVSHDIRTPLTSIIGYLGLIEDKQYSSIEDLERYIHIAYEKALQMKVLVDDLFEYTKVRQPATPLNYTKLDLGKFLEQVAAEFELESARRKIEIEVIMKTDPLMVEVDVDKIVRVFGNLISNALKYGEKEGWIKIQADKVGSEAVISVINSGEKIPQEALEELFGRFYRLESSRSQQTGGTGLGLAIAQSIVALHGGYIYAESDDEETKFVMHLPLIQSSE